MSRSRIQVVSGDITTLDVQAVVTAANVGLLGGGGVDGAIHAAAGPDLLQACQQVAPCPTGQSRITPGFNLRADWVVHSVGPVYRDGQSGEPELLASAYWTALELAEQHRIESIAFPCISTGIYGFPAAPASEIAIATACRWIDQCQVPELIVFCCFDSQNLQLYEAGLAS